MIAGHYDCIYHELIVVIQAKQERKTKQIKENHIALQKKEMNLKSIGGFTNFSLIKACKRKHTIQN